MDTDILTALAVVLWATSGIMAMCWSFKRHPKQPSAMIFGWTCGGPLALLGYGCYIQLINYRLRSTNA